MLPVAWLAAALIQDEGEVEQLKVHEKERRVTFGARAAKQDVYEQLRGFIEYLLVCPKGKEYESLFICPLDPMRLHEALKKIGVEPGRPAGETEPPAGGKIRAFVEWKEGGRDRREPIEAFVIDAHAGKPMEPRAWVFTGSREAYDPETDQDVLQVAMTKNVMTLYQEDSSVLIQNSLKAKDSHSYKPNKALLPKAGTAVRIVFEAEKQ
jgi:hypothetical protein